MTVTEKVYGFCRREKLFDTCTGCVLGVSGGPDSLAMLHLLHTNKGLFDFPLAVAHINHGLRREANEEEQALHRYCDTIGVPFYVLRPDLQATLPQGVGMETYARQVRYDFFEKLRTGLGYSHIATAHTSDDNIETFLLRLCRGSGTEGLTGIRPLRDGVVARPLLCLYKSEILAYCEENNLAYAVDQTNFEPICTRNVFRNDILPRLVALNPSFKDAVLHTEHIINEDNDALDAYADEAAKTALQGSSLLIPPLQSLSPAVRHRLYKKAFARVSDGTLTYEKITALDALLEEQTSSRICLTDTVCAVKTYDALVFGKQSDEKTFAPFTLCEGTFDLGVFTLTVTRVDMSADLPLLDAVVRPRQEGDTLCVYAKQGTKTLKKFFTEKRIPSSDRACVPVVEQNGSVVWAGFIGRSVTVQKPVEGYKLTLAKKSQSL